MASKSEIKKEVSLALSEIGKIIPWFDKEFNTWIYSNPLYPVECEGKTSEEVIKKYPKYLEVFIEHRLKGTLDPINEKMTKGKGGARPGAGRPIGSVKEPTKQIRLPADIADWLKTPGVILHIQEMLKAYEHNKYL
jgi:hypothetical protein